MTKPRYTFDLIMQNVLNQPVYYFITTRIVGGSFILHEKEKKKLRELFSQARQRHMFRLVDFCLMTNHFHAVMRIDPPLNAPRKEVLRRWQLKQRVKSPEDPGDEILNKFNLKIHDISFIVGNISQRFAQWYNKENDRLGTLFTRFDAAIIEPGSALSRVMAYITMNPVRGNMVEKPQQYQWCGFTERLHKGMLDDDDETLIKDLYDSWGVYEHEVKGLDLEAQCRKTWQNFHQRLLGENTKGKDGLEKLRERIEKAGSNCGLDWKEIVKVKVRFAVKGIAIGSSRKFIEEILNRAAEKLDYKRPHHAEYYHIWDEIYSLKHHRHW